MFSLLNPAALLGLIVLTIPIAIHLLAPRKVRQTPFSSLRWLQQSQHQQSKRIRWHQVLLFLLRAAMLVLLVLALAQPHFQGQDRQMADRLIILDTGRTLGYRAGEAAPIDHARAAVVDLLKQTAEPDRAAVVASGAADGGTRLLAPWSDQPQRDLDRVDSARLVGHSPTLNDSLALVQAMMDRARPGAGLELVVVTDNRPSFWSPAAIAQLREQARQRNQSLAVRVVDVAPAMPANAWIADARVVVDEAGQRQVLAVVQARGSSVSSRELIVGDDLARRAVQVGAQPTWVSLPLPANSDVQSVELRLMPGDGLPDDDAWIVPLQREAKRLLLVTGAGDPAAAPSRVHLLAALHALQRAGLRQLEVIHRHVDDLASEDIDGADAVILADVPSISLACVQALQQRVGQGAGLLVFVGPSLDAAAYDAMTVMPAQLGPPQRAAEPVGVVVSRPDHRLLEGLFDPAYGDLAGVQVRQWLRLIPRQGAEVVASLEPGVPFVVMRPLGAGLTIMVNSTANDAWSDLPRRQVFVPLLDRLLGAALGGQSHTDAVQTDRADSAMEVLDAAQLQQAWGDVPLSVVRHDGLSRSSQGSGPAGVHVAAVLLVMACISLMLETWLVYRRCPGRNPQLARSRVSEGMTPRMEARARPQPEAMHSS